MGDESLEVADNRHELIKYSKRVITARIIIYTLAGLCLLISVFGIVVGLWAGVDSDSESVVYSFGGIGMCYLILGLLSIRKPALSVLVAALINLFLLISLIISLITVANLYQDAIFSIVPIIQIFLAFFLFRGFVSARKRGKPSSTG